MRCIRDDLWLCDDCTIAAVNGERLGPNLVANYDSEAGDGILEFSRIRCDSCDSLRYGGRHRFAVLGGHEPPNRRDTRDGAR